MKTYVGIIAAIALAVPWSSRAQEVVDGYSVLKVCQEDLVLHTTDGAEAGRIGYVVVEPGSQRIVSALVTGGVLAERVVAVPFTSMRFKSAREVSLVDIDRQRLISAPVVERTHLTSTTTRFEPSYFERSYTHFGGNAADLRVGVRSETRSRTDLDRDREGRTRDGRADRDRTSPDATDPSRTDRADTPPADRTKPDSTSQQRTDRATSEAQRSQPSGTTTPESRAGQESRRSTSQPDSSATERKGQPSAEERKRQNQPGSTSPDSPSSRPGTSDQQESSSRPGAASKSGEDRPADASRNTPGSSNRDAQSKESPSEKKTPGADSTDPANRRPDRDNPENKGQSQKSDETPSSQKPGQGNTPSGSRGENDKRPL